MYDNSKMILFKTRYCPILAVDTNNNKNMSLFSKRIQMKQKNKKQLQSIQNKMNNAIQVCEQNKNSKECMIEWEELDSMCELYKSYYYSFEVTE